MQQQYGADKFVVVLLSVDPEYFTHDTDYLREAKKILQEQKIDWPCAFLPGGWKDVTHTFNIPSEYGNIVVDRKGIVRGVHVHGNDLPELIGRLVDR